MYKILILAVALSCAGVFAQSSSSAGSSSSVYIGNICDTLKLHTDVSLRTLTFALDTIVEYNWQGTLSAKANATVTKTIHRNVSDVVPLRKQSVTFPVSVAAQCLESTNPVVTATYSASSWAESSASMNTQLYNMNEVALTGYTSAYNWLAFAESWPSDGMSFDASQVAVSPAFDVHAATYRAVAVVADTVYGSDGKPSGIKYTMQQFPGLDSAATFDGVTASLATDKTVSVQMFRIVLSDSRLINTDTPTAQPSVVSSPKSVLYSVARSGSGFLVRGPAGEVPAMRTLNGSAVNASGAVNAGLYLVSVKGAAWQKLVVAP